MIRSHHSPQLSVSALFMVRTCPDCRQVIEGQSFRFEDDFLCLTCHRKRDVVHFLVGNRYYVAQVSAPRPGQQLGHDGAEFTIRFASGRVLISRNVWWTWGLPVPEGLSQAEMEMNWPPTCRHGWQEGGE